VENVNELHDTNVRAAECVTNEILISTCRESEFRLDVCRASNGAHIQNYWAHRELYGVKCLKMCRFLHYTLQLNKWFILLYFKIGYPVFPRLSSSNADRALVQAINSYSGLPFSMLSLTVSLEKLWILN
jgi:hypothetical protein